MDSSLFSTKSRSDFVKIATLLRDQGDRLLNFTCTLSLTLDFLVKLNEAFDLIVESNGSSCFQVINTNNSSEEYLHDLQFLHDFVQKISGLRIWSKPYFYPESVGLDKFRALQYLYLHKVRVENIKITCLRDKLKCLSCSHCNIQDPSTLFGSVEEYEAGNSVGGGVSSSQIWVSLEAIFLPNNDIKDFGSFLSIIPGLKILDLSHNRLTDLPALAHSAENLEYLNVSYNRLKAVPEISIYTPLRFLVINNNQVADIKEVRTLFRLEHIDLSYNLLQHHESLEVILKMSGLEVLNLEGNPLAFRKEHRLLTARYVYPFRVSKNFILDGRQLSGFEMSHFWMLDPRASCLYLSNSKTNMPLPSHGEYNFIYEQPPLATEGRHGPSQTVDAGTGVRQSRIREASISEGEDQSRSSNMPNETLMAAETEIHLEIKRIIESLRKSFGEENWLHEGGGQRILKILGLPVITPNAPMLEASNSSSPPSVIEVINDFDYTQVITNSDCKGGTACENALEVLVEEDMGGGSAVATEGPIKEEEVAEEEMPEAAEEERKSGAQLGVFVAQRRGIGDSWQKDDLLLVVTDRYIIECDAPSGRELPWKAVRTLAAVSVGDEAGNSSSQMSINLMFKNNYGVVELVTYLLVAEEVEELLPLLQDILEKNRSLSETADQFTCLKCSTSFVFSRPISSGEGISIGVKENDQAECVSSKCPKCGSSAVVQHFVEEVKSSEGTAAETPELLGNSSVSGNDMPLQISQKKDPIALWAADKLNHKKEGATEASGHGLHLHILLNILPDGKGNENEISIQDVLVFQETSGEVFYGHLVISSDSVYILKEAEHDVGGEERRLSGDESTAPVLQEWHPTQNCIGAVETCSGYFMKFGPQPASTLWLFPHCRDEMRDVMNKFTSFHKDQELLVRKNDILLEVLMYLPAAVTSSLYSGCDIKDCSNLKHGIIMLTSSMIYFVEFGDLSHFMSEVCYLPSHSRRISDLIGLDGAPNTFRDLPGIVLHFSGEESEEKYVLWPWSDDILLELLYALQKPWEDVFSVPFEEILNQTTSQ